MSAQDRSVVVPNARTWTFGGHTYEQAELTIAGEVRLAQLATRTLRTLLESGFDIDKIGDLINDSDSPNLVVASELLFEILATVPELAVESSTILLGLAPKNPDGSVNKDYTQLREALANPKGGIKFADWYEMLKVFVEQNDWRRLVTPFVEMARKLIQIGSEMNPSQASASQQSLPDSTSSPAADTETPSTS